MSTDDPLKSYFESMPEGQRYKARLGLAAAHGVTIGTTYAWGRNRHPGDLPSLQTTEKYTGYRVTRFELRPDQWDLEELTSFLIETGLLRRMGVEKR